MRDQEEGRIVNTSIHLIELHAHSQLRISPRGSLAAFQDFRQSTLAPICCPQCHLPNGAIIGDQVEMKGNILEIEVIIDQRDRSDGNEMSDSRHNSQ